MVELLTGAQMRAIEHAAIDSGTVTGRALMERAGAGVVEAIGTEWPELAPGPAIVLCGPGNNGGDGFVIARLLHAQGWRVEVYLFGDRNALPPDAAENYRLWAEVGDTSDVDALIARHGRGAQTGLCFQGQHVVFVDALFGTGLTRPVGEALSMFLADARSFCAGRTLAVDFPSGHCADSGRTLGPDSALSQSRGYDLTVTFHRPKAGHVTLDGALASGRLRVVDIGLDRERVDCDETALGAPNNKVAQWLGRAGLHDPGPSVARGAFTKSVHAHKYDHGHALVMSGPPGQGGAARLAARGALRVGAGLVTVGCPLRGIGEHAVHLNAIMVRGLDGTAGLSEMLEDKRFNAICLGPGLGLGPATGELVRTALAAQLGTVLDADALSRFQRDPDALFSLLHENVVLTPHAGEFARLFPDIAARLNGAAESGPAYSKLDATRDAAHRAGCVVLFKGPDTVVSDPQGNTTCIPALYEREAPWLATAGAGDVLAGLVTGLLARGEAPARAAELAVYLHIEAARAFGPGLIAEDLPDMLPRVFRDLEG